MQRSIMQHAAGARDFANLASTNTEDNAPKLFTALHCMQRGLSDHRAVCLSVRPTVGSVRLSVRHAREL